MENLAYGFTKEEVTWEKGTREQPAFGGLDENIVYINSEGFRGSEFSKTKLDNTYRIFTMGGSTTFGSGVLDHQTFPFYLQEFYDQANLPVKVEVINAGWPFKWSYTEIQLIKMTLLDYEPDLFIVFDGWNDLRKENAGVESASALKWKQRWMDACERGKLQGFDTIITLQPAVNTGKKILTNQELESKLKTEKQGILENYPLYIEQLAELNKHCTVTADLTGIFNNVEEPIFWDEVHTGPKGNHIIAEKIYYLSLPIVREKIMNWDSKIDFKDTSNGEFESDLILTESNETLEDFYFTLRAVISSYKTPRVFPLIFES